MSTTPVYVPDGDKMIYDLWARWTADDEVVQLIARNSTNTFLGAILLLLTTIVAFAIASLLAIAIFSGLESLFGLLELETVGFGLGVIIGGSLWIGAMVYIVGTTSGIFAAAVGESYGQCFLIVEWIVVIVELCIIVELIG